MIRKNICCQGKVLAISISARRGTKKKNVKSAELKEDFGILNDAHAGRWHRQVSLLAIESMQKIIDKGLRVKPGDFAENICIEGIDLSKIKIGTQIMIGNNSVLEVTQIGKECHNRCHIYYTVGDCVMPKEGIFTRVIKSGVIKAMDKVWTNNAFLGEKT